MPDEVNPWSDALALTLTTLLPGNRTNALESRCSLVTMILIVYIYRKTVMKSHPAPVLVKWRMPYGIKALVMGIKVTCVSSVHNFKK